MLFSSVMKMDKERNVQKKWLGGAQTFIRRPTPLDELSQEEIF